MVSKFRNPNRSIYEDVTRTLKALPLTSLRKVILATFLTVLSNILDLIAVGIVGATAVLVIGSEPSEGSRVIWLLKVIGISNLPIQTQILTLSIIGFSFFTFKTFFLAVTNRRVLFFLSKESAIITSTLLEQIMNRSLLLLNKGSLQERIYALTIGVNTLTVGILASLFSIIADASLLIVLFIGLLYFDPTIACWTILSFSLVAVVLHKATGARIAKYSERYASKTIASQQDIQVALNLYREIRTRNTTKFFLDKISLERQQLAFLQAEMRFLPSIGKYIFELSIVSISLLVAWYQFRNSDSTKAISAMALFLAASTRMAPSIMRLQQGIVSLKSSIGMCDPTFSLISELSQSKSESIYEYSKSSQSSHVQKFSPRIEVKGLNFCYPNSPKSVLRNVNFELESNLFSVVKGKSGSGKSTLVDIVLGLLPVYEGKVSISGLGPREAIDKFPGKVSYVPQEVILVKGTILENICLGLNPKSITSKNLDFALKNSGLDSIVSGLSSGVHTQLGDRGSGISGGQKQRLGLARALVTRPELLILDEATSALDLETERDIIKNLQKLKKQMSIVVISHRKEILNSADVVIDIRNRRVKTTSSKKINLQRSV